MEREARPNPQRARALATSLGALLCYPGVVPLHVALGLEVERLVLHLDELVLVGAGRRRRGRQGG